MSEHGLSFDQLAIIRSILSPYASNIEQVGLFGSRANGTARLNSDIDIVLYGAIDQETADHIWTLFDESSLAIKVDVNAYSLITHLPLKAHIDAVVKVLFTQTDLLA